MFALIVLLLLFSRSLAGEALVTTFLGQQVDLPNAEVRHAKSVQAFGADIAVIRQDLPGGGFRAGVPLVSRIRFQADENLLLNRPVIVASSVMTLQGAPLVIR